MSDARPIYDCKASEIDAACIGMAVYTEKHPSAPTWDRRGVVDSYGAPVEGLVGIGVDQRDTIYVSAEQQLLFMPVTSA